MTEENISKDTVPEGQDSQEAQKIEQTQQPSEERIQQIIAEQMELARRQFQSEKDKAVAEVKREAENRARIAESRVKAYESALSSAEEDVKPLAEEARRRGDSQFYQDYYQQAEQERRATQYREQLAQSLRDEVVALGLDANDKAIDYASDATDYFSGRKRFTESISKALKAKETEREKELTDKWNQMEADFRKKHGLDSQDTTGGTGVIEQSEADFMAAFGAGNLPVTKENLAKYEGIQKKHYK